MKLLSILIIALASSYSFAAHHEGHTAKHSEALTQAAAGMNRVNLGYNYSSFGLQDEDAPSSDSTANTNRLFLNYERGFNDMFAVGLGLDYVSTSAGNGFNGAGLEHISLFFKGNYNMGSGGLYYGVDVSIAAGKKSVDVGPSGVTGGNGSSGSTDFTPYLAWGMNHGSFAWGLRADYTVRGKQTIEIDTPAGIPDVENEDGNTLKIGAFYERNLSDKSLFGLGISHAMTDFQTDEADADFGNELAVTTLDIYGVVSCGVCDKGGMYFIPKVSYMMATGEAADETDLKSTGGSYAVEFNLRKEF